MNQHHIKWFYDELPGLIDDGLLTAETADRLRGRYGEVKMRSGVSVALIVCSILGSLLIGAGIILLLAHNWSNLTRPMRTILALAPLVAVQALGIRGLLQGKSSAAWREGTSIFHTLAIGAAIALVGQTYHIPGDPGSLLLTWSVLTLPLVYLLRATLPALLYFAGITAWACYQQSHGGHAILFWPLFALTVPALRAAGQKDPYSVRASLLGWAAALCLCIATGVTLEKVLPGLWIIIYSSLFAIFFLAGCRWLDPDVSLFRRPYQAVGAGGIAMLAFLFAYEFPWGDVGWRYYRNGLRFHAGVAWVDYVLVAVLPAIAILMFSRIIRDKDRWKLAYGILPMLAVVCYCVMCWDVAEIGPVLLFNGYLLTLGLVTMVAGIKRSRIGMVNGGMFIITALIIARFFDEDFGFVVRGLAFILLGAGFLVTNTILIKRTKARAQLHDAPASSTTLTN